MNRAFFCLAAIGLIAAVPAFAHGSHAVSGRETHELREKVTDLQKDIRHDNRELTTDERRLITLEMQAAEAKAGKAPPLSSEQRHELAELQNRTARLNKDISRDTKRLTTDEAELKGWQEPSAP